MRKSVAAFAGTLAVIVGVSVLVLPRGTTRIWYPFTTSGTADWRGMPAADLDCRNYVSGNWACTSPSGSISSPTGTKTGTVTGSQATPYYPGGFSGSNALGALFDGATGTFSFGNGLAPTTAMTACGVHTNTAAALGRIISKDDGSVARTFFVADNGDATMRFDVFKNNSTETSLATASSAPIKTWTAWCCSYTFVSDGASVLSCNLNGTASSRTDAVGPIQSTTQTVQIGSAVGAQFFTGTIANVAIWNNFAASQVQLKQAVLAMMGLLGGGGGQLANASTTSRTCVVAGTTFTLAPGGVCINANGLLAEPTRTNLYLNSGAPATQTITVVTGGLAAWVIGSGSNALTVGTAVVTGLPCTATAASPCPNLNVTGAGTVVVTKAGTLTFAQTEQGQDCTATGCLITSEIDTGGATVTRNADLISMVNNPILNNEGGACATVYEPNGVPNTGISAAEVISQAGAGTQLLALSGATSVSAYDGTNQPIATISNVTAAPVRVCVSWSASRNRLAVFGIGGTPATTAYAGVMGAGMTEYLGSQGAASGFLGGYISNLCFTNNSTILGTSSGVGGCQ